MATITIQIGNSDDRLTQTEWAAFVQSVRNIVNQLADEVHFFGAPSTFERWQNAAWIIECHQKNFAALQGKLIEMRAHWRQDSIAWTNGETDFI